MLARDRQVKVRLSTGEWEAVAVAARGAGLTPSGYVAEAAVAAAAGSVATLGEPLRWALGELLQTRLALYGVRADLGQVRGGEVMGEPGPVAPLPQAVEEARRATARLDAAARAVVKALQARGRRAT